MTEFERYAQTPGKGGVMLKYFSFKCTVNILKGLQPSLNLSKPLVFFINQSTIKLQKGKNIYIIDCKATLIRMIKRTTNYLLNKLSKIRKNDTQW